MPSYTVYEDVCSVDEVQTLSRTSCSKSTPMLSSRMSSNKSMMMLAVTNNNNYNQQYNNNINNGKIISSTKQNTKAAMGYVDLNVNPHLLTCGINKENIDPLTGRVYPMSSSSNLFNNNSNSKSNCTTTPNNNIRDPLKDITLSVLGQTSTQPSRIKKLTSSSLQTPQKNKLRNASASTGSLNPLSPSTLYLR
ncbi:hypothetical protein NAEGRDRAFT_80531 [Naegleria gruberi]|uniref:Uncharacterized protein n=1 Tax=Naegleria gruberi TaxID=5762 RepID=D2VME8_NAEGR|nr:uncharacterized protein NAEGRDRAFT_80531 [Naegleria gruberi]EFC42049.1 hypothetical protein NAEGRDRAFT_80531 [Naegleria gruberi]|eukprot:XP_002674793.1 hypothetical protein NAEGRDRAFT_80531 [Naegleria gruberi strain NEG-M]